MYPDLLQVLALGLIPVDAGPARPQGFTQLGTTRSPTSYPFTFFPTATISPQNSCPGIRLSEPPDSLVDGEIRTAYADRFDLYKSAVVVNLWDAAPNLRKPFLVGLLNPGKHFPFCHFLHLFITYSAKNFPLVKLLPHWATFNGTSPIEGYGLSLI
jgi:hypothetical protein